MDDNQLQAWLDQHGGEVGRKDNEKDVDGEINPDTGAPTKKRVVDTTTITARDGATLTLRRSTSGTGPTYSVIENTPPKPSTAAPTAGQKPQGSTTQIEGTPLPGGGFDNERPVMVTRGPDGRLISSEPLTPAEMTEWRNSRERSRNPGGKTDAEVKAEKDKADAANKPGAPVLKPDGKGGTIAVQTMPDGTIKTTPLPGVPSDKPQPQQVTVEGVVYERGPDGTYKPAAGLPTPGAQARNVDEFTPDYSQPDLGLGRWAAAQRQKIGKPADQGGITQKDYDAAVQAAHQQAQVTIQNVTSNQQVVRQRDIDTQTQQNTLSDQGRSDFDAARRIYDATWQYANPNSRNRFSTIPYLMSEINTARTNREGAARPLSPLHPMFTAGAAPRPEAAQQPPSTPPPSAPVFTPQPVAPPPPPPTAGEPGGPPLAPGPVLGDPVPQATSMDASDPAQQGQGITPRQPSSVMPPAWAIAPGVASPTEPDGTATVFSPVSPAPPSWMRNNKTGEIRQMTHQQHMSQPDVGDWSVMDGPPAPPVKPDFGTPDMQVIAPPPASNPQPAVLPHEMVPPGAPVGPATGSGGNVQMAPPQQGPLTAWAQGAMQQPQQQASSMIDPAQMPPAGPTRDISPAERQAILNLKFAPWMPGASQQRGPEVYDGGGGVNPALQSVQQQAARPRFDPYQTAGKLGSWGVPQDAILTALKELGMLQEDETPAGVA